MRWGGAAAGWTALLVAMPGVARAEVTAVEIASREPVEGGAVFGQVGPYERLMGRVRFAVDPRARSNRAVVDLDLAPRNPAGKVEFAADLEILAPRDLSKASGTLLYDVNNRGNRTALGMFNTGRPGWLMERGYIIVSSGWIAELLPGGGRLILEAPVARDRGGRPLRGVVRAEMAPNEDAARLSIAHWANHGSYAPAPASLPAAVLTRRLREADPRQAIPREAWRLDTAPVEADGRASQLPLVECVLEGGFRRGWIYELIYEAEGSLVQGTGLAGIRDLVSFLRRDRTPRNPLLAADGRPVVTRAIGFGVSQSGRCLRQFLYDGFNADEQGRRVFDGVIPHVAGAGLGFFNHRFASPTRHSGQHDNHLYPVDQFPFAYSEETDPLSGRRDGILRRARRDGVTPKVMHIQTSAEYWHRAGSLVHTDPLGRRDLEIPPEVRIYAIGGAQHGPGSGVPGAAGAGQLPANPTDYRPVLRALLTAMERWIAEGAEPPASRYPRIDRGELRGWREAESGWRAVPGVRHPTVINQPALLDYGPNYARNRRITRHPPALRGDYRVRVPGYGPDNNEQGTLLLPTVAVPVGSYTGWALRSPSIGAETELLGLTGSFLPFPKTEADRTRTGDPRLSLERRYPTREEYLRRVRAAARNLVWEGYLLPEEIAPITDLAARLLPVS